MKNVIKVPNMYLSHFLYRSHIFRTLNYLYFKISNLLFNLNDNKIV